MQRLFALTILIRYSGLRHALRIIRYSLWKSLMDRQYQRKLHSPLESGEAPLLQSANHTHVYRLDVQPHEHGAAFRFENARLEVFFLAPDLARLTWEPGELPLPYALAKQDWPGAAVVFEAVAGGWRLSSEAIKIFVQPDGGVQFLSPQGQVLRTELPPMRQKQGWTQRACLAPGEHILGLGEQSAGLDRRSGQYTLWNTDPGGSYGPGQDPLYMPLPVYLGLHAGGSYLVFFENYGPARFDFPSHAPAEEAPLAEAHFESGALRSYFIPGPPARALERYTELTGRAPLPPRWALGYHQSRWGYKNETDIRAVAAGFQEHRLPLSAIHLDIDYMDGFRVFTVDRERFPDLASLSHELREQGIRLVTIIDPGVKEDPGFDVYRQGLDAGLFCTLPGGRVARALVWPGWSVFPDFTDPQARAWWGGLYSRLLERGIAGFWHDMNEPATFVGWGSPTLPAVIRHNLEGRGSDHRQAHNLYGLLMNRAGWEALRRIRPTQRPWIVSRSGWVGQQRFAWNWTGDTESSWPALRMAIAQILGLGLSGQPFSGPDVGGFSGEPDAELYLRAFQMAALLPFFRTHSAIGTPRREPWVYGEPTTGIVRRFLELRYRLLPYLYTLAWESAQTGAPLARPLFWGQEADGRLWGVEDAFLLGEALLAAPVLEAAVRQREVPLPAGAWYDFWDDHSYCGPGTVTVAAPLERMPLLVRAGSVLALETGGRLELNIYAQPAGDPLTRSRLYDDAGDGLVGSQQDWRLDRFSLFRTDGEVRLEWQTEGAYPFRYPNITLRLHGFAARRVSIDGQAAPMHGAEICVAPFREARFQE